MSLKVLSMLGLDEKIGGDVDIWSGVLICLDQTETLCYLFYGPKNSTLSAHLHGALVCGGVGAKTKGGYCAAALCVSSITRMCLSCCQN